MKIGCGLIVAKTKDGEVKCGEKFFGKRRYCGFCQQLHNLEYEIDDICAVNTEAKDGMD